METCTKTKTFEDDVDTFGGFTEAVINITKPMKFDAKMEMRSLTLMCGLNNTGKSVFNKMTWAATFFFNIKLTENTYDVPPEMEDKELMQFILDRTFVDHQFNGKMSFNYRDPLLKVKFYGIDVVMKDGLVVSVKYELSKNTEPMGEVTYLSTDVRNFSNIQKYVKIKKMMGIDEIQTFKDVDKLSEFYKIYDVFAIEFLLKKLDNINVMLEQIQSMEAANDLIKDFDIKSLEYDKENAELNFYNFEDEKSNIISLGQGAQSILIMLMTAH